jgi:hypothetical protein
VRLPPPLNAAVTHMSYGFVSFRYAGSRRRSTILNHLERCMDDQIEKVLQDTKDFMFPVKPESLVLVEPILEFNFSLNHVVYSVDLDRFVSRINDSRREVLEQIAGNREEWKEWAKTASGEKVLRFAKSAFSDPILDGIKLDLVTFNYSPPQSKRVVLWLQASKTHSIFEPIPRSEGNEAKQSTASPQDVPVDRSPSD